MTNLSLDALAKEITESVSKLVNQCVSDMTPITSISISWVNPKDNDPKSPTYNPDGTLGVFEISATRMAKYVPIRTGEPA